MKSSLQIILTIIIMAEFAVGNFANGFIAMVNCANWVRRWRMSSADWVLTALAVSRIGFLWVIFKILFSRLFNSTIFGSENEIVTQIAWVITHHFSAWFAASLSMIYLLKVVNFSNPGFLQLKRRIKSVIGVILLGALVLLFSSIAKIKICKTLGVNECAGNVTWKTNLGNTVDILPMTLFSLATVIPFLTSLICILLLMFSLCQHLRKMRLRGKGSQDPSTRAQVKALQMVVSFLLLFTTYSLAVIISGWSSTWFSDEVTYLFLPTIGTLCPSIHSCLLIWGNRKLNQVFISLLWQARCWLKKKRSSNP